MQIDGKIEAQVAIGVRASGTPRQRSRLKDRWHLGSDTKAMTATLIARLVEQGYLGFDDTMAKLFPGIAARMNPALSRRHGDATADSHLGPARADVRRGNDRVPWPSSRREKGLRAQRAALVVYYLSRRPASKVGEFPYSNIGYTILGAIAEERTGRTWEDLIRGEVWKPLGIRDAGFGPPGTFLLSRPADGARAARTASTCRSIPPRASSDNPPAIGPAGTVHISLRDWLLFAQDQLDGEHGQGKLLKPESYRRLHTAVAQNYAMGWGVLRDQDGSISLLTHTGSNGYWVADVRIVPKRNLIMLTALNAGGDAAEKADRDIGKALQDHLKVFE